jgi:hypothetical protein
MTASATIWSLHKYAYIPDFHLDKTQFANYNAIFVSEFMRCLARGNAVVGAIDTRLDELLPPIRYLPYFMLFVSLFYMMLYSLLLSHVLGSSKFLSLVGVLLAAGVYYSGIFAFAYGVAYYSDQGTKCQKVAADLATSSTFGDRLSRFADESLRPRIGEEVLGAKLLDVEVENKSLIAIFQAPASIASVEALKTTLNHTYALSSGRSALS